MTTVVGKEWTFVTIASEKTSEESPTGAAQVARVRTAVGKWSRRTRAIVIAVTVLVIMGISLGIAGGVGAFDSAVSDNSTTTATLSLTNSSS